MPSFDILHSCPCKSVSKHDFLSSAERSDLMRRITSTRTAPELALADALRRCRFTFETNVADLPGKPDFVFRRKRLAVFVDGEFWHGRQWSQRRLTSLAEQFPDREKRAKWLKKISGNCHRDFWNTARLLQDGWSVIRFWDRDVLRNAEECATMIRDSLGEHLIPSPASLLPQRTCAEFFAGIGLAGLGLRPEGWTVKFANDNAPDKIVFYEANFPDASAYLDKRDVNCLAAGDLPTVSLATACFPCTDLSLAGAQRGFEGTKSSAYLKFTSLLKKMGSTRPPFVLLENVLGMITSRNGEDFTICLTELDKCGYSIDAFVLDARWFVPQSRPRLFVVAIRKDLAVSANVAEPTELTESSLRPRALLEFMESHPRLPWSLRSLPEPIKSRARLSTILEKIPRSDPRWWSDERSKYLVSQMPEEHRQILDAMMAAERPSYGTVFRRMRNSKSTAELRTDGYAGCLRTPKGGSGRQILLTASRGKYAVRLLTPRECARLMGAENITIPSNMSVNRALFAFGDGVCVSAVRWIAEYYLGPVALELIRGRLLKQIS